MEDEKKENKIKNIFERIVIIVLWVAVLIILRSDENISTCVVGLFILILTYAGCIQMIIKSSKKGRYFYIILFIIILLTNITEIFTGLIFPISVGSEITIISFLTTDFFPSCWATGFFVSGLWIILGMINTLFGQSSCNKQITATLEDIYIQNGARGVKLYYPIFSYFYNGKTYTERSFQNESGKTLSSMELEKNYDIFISEKNPEKFVLTKKISYIKAMVALLVGVPLLFIGLHYIILELSLFFHILRYL